jgi:hypothetical protein
VTEPHGERSILKLNSAMQYRLYNRTPKVLQSSIVSNDRTSDSTLTATVGSSRRYLYSLALTMALLLRSLPY